MALTDVKVRNVKAQAKPQKLTDGEGMYLLITEQGAKLWRMQYRYQGKQKTLALGKYPDVSLTDARKRRHDARELLANGFDPMEAKKSQKVERAVQAANTFAAVAKEWHEKFKPDWTEGHAAQIWRRLEDDTFPDMGSRPIAEIKAADVLQVLRRIEPRSLESAHRVKTAIGQVFRYAVATGRAERDPTADLRGALRQVKNNHYSAPTDPKKIGPLMRSLDAYSGSPIVRAALRIMPLVFLRPGELRLAEWVEFDLDAAEWNIPAERMKMKIAHLVPLSRQLVEILRELQAMTGGGRFLFPGHRSKAKPMSDMAVNAALRSMGYDRDVIVGHGFRAMARTLLDEVLGFRPDIIEHQLAHAVKDPLGRAYNRTMHLEARRKMMQDWADYLDDLKTKSS